MISIPISVFAVATFGAISSGVVFPNSSRFKSSRYNIWEVEDFYIKRWDESTSLEYGAAFNLYRSYYNNCSTGPGSILGVLLTGIMCGTWMVPDTPVTCQMGNATWVTNPPWNPGRTSSWSTCDTHLRAVEGDEEVSEEKKKWLKWRIVDLQERDQAATPAAKQFISAKLEIVNGIPIKPYSSNSSTSQVKVFSAIHTLTDGFKCWEFPEGNARYKCSYKANELFATCTSPRTVFCSVLVNVTRRIESIDEWHSRFQKPITKLIV